VPRGLGTRRVQRPHRRSRSPTPALLRRPPSEQPPSPSLRREPPPRRVRRRHALPWLLAPSLATPRAGAIATTADIYADLTPAMLERTAARMDGVLTRRRRAAGA
jgi:hypothetical protein